LNGCGNLPRGFGPKLDYFIRLVVCSRAKFCRVSALGKYSAAVEVPEVMGTSGTASA